MKLVIVESPAKCSKIQGFLGEGYKVQATFGHIRALEESLQSLGMESGWEPKYVDLPTKKDAISKLRAAAKGCEIILATDDDREGEGIAWHVCFLLKLNPVTTPRIVFREITKQAIQSAVANPRRLDMNKVYAQQTRAMLDLLVGFTISRVLWNRVAPKLSAGRCQTPALRLVVERDHEIENHTASAFWQLTATFKHGNLELKADADYKVDSGNTILETLQKFAHKSTQSTVQSSKESVRTSQPPKPLITSTLQQEASSLHGINPKSAMMAAQKLYEAGHITYMRTDNPTLSDEAVVLIRAHITTMFGKSYLGDDKDRIPSTSKRTNVVDIQAAHEAIRPTHPEISDVDVEDSVQRTIYKLIWKRATQSQMAPCQTDVRKITIRIESNTQIVWNTEQTKTRFAGWKILETRTSDSQSWDEWSPILCVGTVLHWNQLCANELFTKPKGRFTEASLIHELEKCGIGRPSTFASLVSTIEDRNYVEKTNVEGVVRESRHIQLSPNSWPPHETKVSHKVGAEKNKIRSTPLGKSVCEFLTREYSDLFEYAFTAEMEHTLDEIAKGEKQWKSLLQGTWERYKDRYAEHSTQTSRERQLSPEIKVILSRKGPLFVKGNDSEKSKSKSLFAPLPSSCTYETATLEDAEKAFREASVAKQGEQIGVLESVNMYKKKGPYGWYVEWNGIKLSLRDETHEQICEKLLAKKGESSYTRVLGDFTIRKGPYGLYFFKHTLKKATFVTFPSTLDPEKVNTVDIQALYSDGLAKKKRKYIPKKPKKDDTV